MKNLFWNGWKTYIIHAVISAVIGLFYPLLFSDGKINTVYVVAFGLIGGFILPFVIKVIKTPISAEERTAIQVETDRKLRAMNNLNITDARRTAEIYNTDVATGAIINSFRDENNISTVNVVDAKRTAEIYGTDVATGAIMEGLKNK